MGLGSIDILHHVGARSSPILRRGVRIENFDRYPTPQHRRYRQRYGICTVGIFKNDF